MARFADIIGQDTALQVLHRALSSGKLGQAYCFTGPRGVGKGKTALTLAAALSCQENPGEGCLTCPSCAKIEAGLHPDLFRIAPDGASIKIDQVRALEEHLGFPPHEGRYRVVIIDDADALNLHATNALLKSVEEPRPRTLFILVTAAAHRLAPTLLSRCQRLRFLPLSPADIRLILRGTAAEDTALHAAASLAGGSAGRALELLEGERLPALRATMSALLAARRGPMLGCFTAAAEAGKDRLALAEALDYLRLWFRDALLLLLGTDERHLLHADQLPQLRETCAGESERSIRSGLRAIDDAQAALRGNVHPTLALENLVLSLRQATSP